MSEQETETPQTETVVAVAHVNLTGENGFKIPPGARVEIEVGADGRPVNQLERTYQERRYISLPGDPNYPTDLIEQLAEAEAESAPPAADPVPEYVPEPEAEPAELVGNPLGEDEA